MAKTLDRKQLVPRYFRETPEAPMEPALEPEAAKVESFPKRTFIFFVLLVLTLIAFTIDWSTVVCTIPLLLIYGAYAMITHLFRADPESARASRNARKVEEYNDRLEVYELEYALVFC